ncbi:MAG: hypothetical protein U1A22_07070, partial [Xanthomonadaceae bacterium]|nr:hypothetical protein [Xanthomonadaceae bacterium]
MSRIDLETGTRTEMTSGEGRVRSFTVERQSNGTRTHTDEAPDSTKDLLNLDRQVTAIERPGGETVSFDYDAGGRLASRTLPTRVTRYGYIASTGQLADIAGPDAIDLAFEWDGLLPKASTWSGPVSGRVGYRFDSNLWPIEETVNGEAVAFGYDA